MDQRALRQALSFLTAGVLALGICSAGVLAAGEPKPPQPAYDPPVFSGPTITLMEAIRTTLEHEPNIKLQAESAASQEGIAQQATGQFDLALVGKIDYSFVQEELSAAQKVTEQEKRDRLRDGLNQYSDAADLAAQQANEYYDAWTTLQNGGDPSSIHFTDGLIQAEYDVFSSALLSAPPELQDQVRADIIKWLQSRQGLAESARDDAVRARNEAVSSLRDLGTVPQVRQQQQGTISLQLSKAYRTGIILTPSVDISGSALRYRGKPADSDHGGPGSPDTYNATVGFSVNIPLGRGRGIDSAGALEKSSLIDYEASLSSLTHQAASSVLGSILAYWDLVAAQKTLDVYQQSAALQQKLVELTKTLIDADEMPRVELARADARQSEVQAQVEDAKRSLYQARVTLARTIGLRVESEGQAPLAGDPFPKVPEVDAVQGIDVAVLGDLSLKQRLDYRAAQQLQESGKVLWKAAVIDLAPDASLDINVSYSGSHYGGSLWDGLDGAFFGNWTGPSAKVGLTYNKPFANNTQRGRLEEKGAILRQRAITTQDLARTIRASVVQDLAVLEEAVRQLALYQRSAQFYRESVSNELEKLRYGRSTLINTITTEQREVQAKLALVSSEQQVARSLAQLRFDSGFLVLETAAGEFVSYTDITSLPSVEAGQ
jgi:outer membrane protein